MKTAAQAAFKDLVSREAYLFTVSPDAVVSGLVRGTRIEPPKPSWLRRDLGGEPPVPSKPLDQ